MRPVPAEMRLWCSAVSESVRGHPAQLIKAAVCGATRIRRARGLGMGLHYRVSLYFGVLTEMAAEYAEIAEKASKCLVRVDLMYVGVFAVLEHGARTVHGARALGKVNSAFSGLGHFVSRPEPVEMPRPCAAHA